MALFDYIVEGWNMQTPICNIDSINEADITMDMNTIDAIGPVVKKLQNGQLSFDKDDKITKEIKKSKSVKEAIKIAKLSGEYQGKRYYQIVYVMNINGSVYKIDVFSQPLEPEFLFSSDLLFRRDLTEIPYEICEDFMKIYFRLAETGFLGAAWIRDNEMVFGKGKSYPGKQDYDMIDRLVMSYRYKIKAELLKLVKNHKGLSMQDDFSVKYTKWWR